MEKVILFVIFIFLFSCKKTNEKIEIEVPKKELKTNMEEYGALTYEQFKNSKWVTGEVGVNGEMPDTIIFYNEKNLVYIDSNTGKEECKYSFVKDTLVFTSISTEFDIDSDKEIINESISKFHFKNNRFKFIFCCQKKSTEKEFKCTNMEKYNLTFRKI